MKFIKLSIYIVLVLICNSILKSQDTYLNPDLSSKERVELLLREMNLDEKIGQMCQYVAEPSVNVSANKDEEVSYILSIGERADLIRQGKIGSFLKVPGYEEANDLQKLAEQSRLKIPLLIATDAMHGHGMYEDGSTIYPTQVGIASSFDTNIARQIAENTAVEMRATGYHWTFSPNVEIVRDSRWGRFGETFGEDPFLVSEMGKAMIRGYQGNDFSGSYNVLSCAKHFAGGGISYNGLNGAATDISERTLYEIFFPPFAEAINAGVYTIMPAHNEINGIPCHAHEEYLSGLIRDTWGFNGFIISDWLDIKRLQLVHHITASEKESDRVAVLAGLDMHMHGPGFFNNVKELVEDGEISVERIDDAVRKILYAKFQLGLFEDRYAETDVSKNTLLKKEHRDLALEAARRSIVLLQNKENILPLNKNINSIFITGPNADNQAIIGDWAKIQKEENIITVLEGIQDIVSSKTTIEYLKCESYDSIPESLLEEAAVQAGSSDIAIIVAGENSIRFGNHTTSGENLDRPLLELAGEQLKLVKAVESSGIPVIIVLINGGPIASEWMVEHTDAIIEAWEPGMTGGQAVAEVLFGDYNPAGKLPVTIPRSVGHIQHFYNHKPSTFHRGKFYLSERKPLFEFGHGLSYTEFEYSDLKIPKKIGINDDLKFTVTVQNTGSVGGDEVILVYLNDKISSVTTPVKKLVEFRRIHLKSGETKELEFIIPNRQFELYDKDMSLVVEPGEFEIMVGNNMVKGIVTVE